jgi:hypothetical protein
VKQLLAQVCPGKALVGIIGIGNEVTRSTLRTIMEGGLGPQALLFDNESEESIATIVLGSINALVSSELRQVVWPGGKMVGSQPHVQCNSSEVCAGWALYPNEHLAPTTPADEDEEWEVVATDGTAARAAGEAPCIRWLGGASVSIAAQQQSEAPVQLPTLLVTDEDAVKSMCIAAALARCRHASCHRKEATKLALRYGFVCAEADSVMVATSDQPAADPSGACASFGIAIPSHPVKQAQPVSPTSFKRCKFRAPRSAVHPSPLYDSFSSHSSGGASAMDGMAFAQARNRCKLPTPHKGIPKTAGCSSHITAADLKSAGFFSVMHQNAHAAPPAHISRDEPDAARLSAPLCPPPPVLYQTQSLCAFGISPMPHQVHSPTPPPPHQGAVSLLDLLGAMRSMTWSLCHPAVCDFIAKHLPDAAALCASDDHVTVAVIVVLRACFKGSKSGWHAHVKRAAHRARAALGDAEYCRQKAALKSALKP